MFPTDGTVIATSLVNTRSIKRAPLTGADIGAVERSIDITTMRTTPVAPGVEAEVGAGAGVRTAKKIENEKVRILERMMKKIRTKGKRIIIDS